VQRVKSFLFLFPPRKHASEFKYSSVLPLTSELNAVSFQHNTSVVLPHGKTHRYTFRGPQRRYGRLKRRWNFSATRIRKRLLGHSNCRLVSTATDLPRILSSFVNCSGFLTFCVEVDVLDFLRYISKLCMRHAVGGKKYVTVKLVTVVAYFKVLLLNLPTQIEKKTRELLTQLETQRNCWRQQDSLCFSFKINCQKT
jgi:hypothetical protein